MLVLWVRGCSAAAALGSSSSSTFQGCGSWDVLQAKAASGVCMRAALAGSMVSDSKNGQIAGATHVTSVTPAVYDALASQTTNRTLMLHRPALQGWATAGFLPGRHWWSCYWAASTPLLPAHRAQELATSLWAAAQLQQHPPAAWLAGFWAASSAALPHASPQELCMMLWGVVTLQLRPGGSWWAGLQAAAASRAQQMAPRDVAQVRLNAIFEL